jgi:hypothetical protein
MNGGALVGGSIYGGYSGAGPGASASGNTVFLLSGSVAGDVYGGYSDTGAATTGNTVNVDRNFSFAVTTRLSGGNGADSSSNTLNTRGSGFVLNGIGNFASYAFTLTGDDVGKAVYTLEEAVDLSGAALSIVFDNNGEPMETGANIILFSGAGATGSPGNGVAVCGAMFDHDIDFLMNGAGLSLVVRSAHASGSTRMFGQSRLAGLHMLKLAGDFQRRVADMAAAAEAVRADDTGGTEAGKQRPAVFAGVIGGSSILDTGGDSEASVAHAAMLAGLGRRLGDILLAGYFETGRGWYDATLNGDRLNKNDRADYFGGGALARLDFGDFFAEGSVHAGVTRTAFGGVVRGMPVEFDSRAAYCGADAVFGRRLDLGSSRLDLSLAYGWNRLAGDAVRVGANNAALDSVDSHRLRAGGRWAAFGSEGFAPYAGAAAEYELDGESSGRISGHSLVAAETRGLTGVGELGLRLGGAGYTADIGIEGYLGRRLGVAAKAALVVFF